jgi:hypothetical protein
VPLLEPIKQRIEAAQSDSMTGSKLDKACAYVLGQWPKLVRVFDYGEVELDTNWAEPKHSGDGQPIGCPKGEAKPSQNSVRPLVLGRKNWMHVGSWEAGPRVAAIASVIESSKRLGINPREYLADVLPRLANGTTSEVPSLTPAAWLRHRSGQPAA